MNLRKLVLSMGLSLLLVSSLALAQPKPESDTVPTAQLDADFLVMINTGDVQAQLSVDLFQVTEVNGSSHYEQANLSKDETVTFSIGTTSVVFDTTPGTKNNVIPYVPGGTYLVTFKRFNGEVYTSQVAMPTTTVEISSPKPKTVFQKSDAVEIDWNDVTAQFSVPMLITIGCGQYVGEPTFSKTWAKIPPGYASKCADVVNAAFAVAYANIDGQFSGLRGGISAGSMAIVSFSYGNSLKAFSIRSEDMKNAITAARRKAAAEAEKLGISNAIH